MVVACALIGAGVATVLVDRAPSSPAEPLPTENPLTTGDFERSLREAVEKNPGDEQALASLGNLFVTTGRVSEAVTFYERALAVDPKNEVIRLNFATSLAQAEKRPDAEVQFRKILTQDPKSVEARFYLADLYRTWQPPRGAEAIELYQEVIRFAPDAYLAHRARNELGRMGVSVGTPDGLPAGTPVGAGTEVGT